MAASNWVILIPLVLLALLRGSHQVSTAIGVHITLGTDPYIDRTVMFVSKKSIKSVDVQMDNATHTKGEKWKTWKTFNAKSLKLNITGPNKGNFWIQRANLSDLAADQYFDYRIGAQGETRKFFFKTWRMRNPQETYLPPILLFYGNIEDANGKNPAYTHLQEDIHSNKYAGIFNLGSLACGKELPQYLANLEGLAAQTPLLTTPGEFEHENSYQLYSQLFSMPNTDWPMEKFWYSFNTEKAHIISINTELYGLEKDGMRIQQLRWLKDDLHDANDASKRNLDHTPWIIVFTHRSFYCSGDKNCTKNRHKLKELEDLFYHFGVDLVISAQDNFYQRTWPVYQDTHHQTSYMDPMFPTYVSTAAFTCNMSKDNPHLSTTHEYEWEAKIIDCRGMSTYGHLYISNSTHLYWEEINAVKGNRTILDKFYLVQHHHGPFLVKVGHSSAVIAIVTTCVVILVVGAAVILFWSRCRHYFQKKRAAKEMRYVNLNEGQLEL